jgi:hypothetical protein
LAPHRKVRMAELLLRGKEVQSVFHLLGEHENDLTYSLAWALSRSPEFLKAFIRETLDIQLTLEKVTIRLQHREKDAGITDIEIDSPGQFFALIEAKRGWNLPGKAQLEKYAFRKVFDANDKFPRKIFVLSECSHEYAIAHLSAKTINGVAIVPISWKNIADTADRARQRASHAEKRLLIELLTYFRGLMTMQNTDSNWVYVVSLGSDTPDGWKLSWIDVVEKRGKYFHPVGDGWPKEPPNYVAFRYYGRLQSIHHIEGYTVFDDPHDEFPEIPSVKWPPHFLYTLSAPFAPAHEVRTGKLYRNGRVKCMLDTLFLAKTISEARDISKRRAAEA